MFFPGSRTSRHLLTVFQILLLFAATPGGQCTPASAQAASEPSAAADQVPAASPIRPASDTVSLDLVAHTKKNKPVLDLRIADLAITDNGTTVHPSDLHLMTESSDRLITLLFDRLSPSSTAAARSVATKMLRVIPNKGYSVAVFQMGSRLRLVQAFTSDPAVIHSAVETATSTQDHPAVAGLTPAENDLFRSLQSDSLTVDAGQRARAVLLRAGLEDAQRFVGDQRTNPSIAALRALAESQRQIPGRKFVFWFSDGMRGDAENRDAIRLVITEANRAGLTLYTVDTGSVDQSASGQIQNVLAMSVLAVGAPVSSHSSGRASPGGSRGGGLAPGEELSPDVARNTMALQFGAIDAGHSPLTRLAADTGGVYLRASSVSKRQLQQLQSDLATCYQISWPLPQEKYNDTFRPVTIRALRKNLVVRTRSGYFALPPDEHADILPWEAPLFRFLAAEPLPSAIAFRHSLLRLGSLPDGNTTELAIEVPVSQLQIREDANTHISAAHASLLAVIRDSKGTILRHFSKDVPLHQSPDVLRRDPDQTITLQDHFSPNQGSIRSKLWSSILSVIVPVRNAPHSPSILWPPRPR